MSVENSSGVYVYRVEKVAEIANFPNKASAITEYPD